MKHCCDKEEDIAALKGAHLKVLQAVLAINLIMFLVEMTAGWLSQSTSLLADSLDMLGDSLVYGFSLYVLNRSIAWQARASLLKGGIMLLFGVAVIVEAIFKVMNPIVPGADMMTWIGLLALAMNSICFALLWRHRDDNINLQSTWICSRNDLIANCGVLLAALLTAVLSSRWPDLIIGLLIAAVFLQSAVSLLRQAIGVISADRCSE